MYQREFSGSCLSDKHENLNLTVKCQLTDGPWTASLIFLSLTKGPNTGDHWWVTGMWTSWGELGHCPTLSSSLLLKKTGSRRLEAELKLCALFTSFIPRAFSELPYQRVDTINLYSVCAAKVWLPNNG